MKNFGRFLNVSMYAFAGLAGAIAAYLTFPHSNSDIHRPYQTDSYFSQTHQPEFAALSSRQQEKKLATPNATSLEKRDLCLRACLEMSNRLLNTEIIDDEAYENLFGEMHDLAAYLETNHEARMNMLQLAMTTQEGNRRNLIVNAFTLLPLDQQETLGHNLLKSQNWRARLDGANLSISPEILTPHTVDVLFKTIEKETHPVIKMSILNGMKNAGQLKNNESALDNISHVLRTDTDPTVRSAAILTKLELSRNPHDVLPDSFMALNSGEIELQQTALIALERIYDDNKLIDGGLDRIDHEAVRRALDDFMDVEINAENEKAMDRLLTQSDRFYERHFGSAH